MGLAAVAAHKIGGLIPVGAIFRASVRIGQKRAADKPEPAPVADSLRVLN
jgi:hypothetical protein